MSPIVTHFDPKPIPTTAFDWDAARAGHDEDDPVGYGPTEQAAIDDLLAQEEARADQEEA